MTVLAREIEQAIGTRSVQQAADEWGLPAWILRDLMRGKSRTPRVEHLPALARGLGVSVDELVEKITTAAY